MNSYLFSDEFYKCEEVDHFFEISEKEDRAKIVVESCFENLIYVKYLGSGANEINTIIEVCDKNLKKECGYALKITKQFEADVTKTLGDVGISPKVYDVIQSDCYSEDAVGLVMEKMDGSLTDFYPFNEETCEYLLSSMVDLIYRSIFEHGISQNDPKVGNFLYKKTNDKNRPTVYLADFDVASEVESEKKEEFLFNINSISKVYLDIGDYDDVYYEGKKVHNLLNLKDKTPSRIFLKYLVKVFRQEKYKNLIPENEIKSIEKIAKEKFIKNIKPEGDY